MFRRSLVSLAVITLISVAPLAHAQGTYTFFPDDATVNYAVNANYAIVGYASGTFDSNFTPQFQTPSSPTVNVGSNGTFVNYLLAYNSSTVNMSGGNVGINLFAESSSTVNLSGGSISGSLYAEESGTVNIRGGRIGTSLYASQNAILNFFGSNLIAPLIDPNVGGLSRYSLSGTLADGTVLTNKNLYIQNGSNARFTLNSVPAPGSLLTALIGVVPGILVLRRRKSR